MSLPMQSLTLHTRLSTSPHLLQTVRLLQMSSLEFEQELQQQLALNPFLEDAEPVESADEDAAGPLTADEISSAEAPLFDHASLDAATADGSPLEATIIEADDWTGLLPEAGFERPPHDGDDAGGDDWNRATAQTSLRDHLLEQIDGARLAERERLAAILVIETIDDDGYLRCPVAETALLLKLPTPLTEAETAAGIRIVQQLDPPGLAARDLAECLVLQLQELPAQAAATVLALKLAAGHLELLARHDYRALQGLLDCSLSALIEAQALIRGLDPRPGRRFGAALPDYIVPDVIVLAQGRRLVTMTNPALLPRARLNLGTIELLRSCDAGGYPALRQQLQEAHWLLRSATQRHTTIQRVAEAIVATQRSFFQYGEVALKPLLLREIADDLELHESTLSRATSNKYMATPRGIFEFRHFFSRQLGTYTGGSCSSSAVRALIRDMIDGESQAAPLSDVVLASRLGGQGIRVARRTVTKYRNQMKLPPGEFRYLR